MFCNEDTFPLLFPLKVLQCNILLHAVDKRFVILCRITLLNFSAEWIENIIVLVFTAVLLFVFTKFYLILTSHQYTCHFSLTINPSQTFVLQLFMMSCTAYYFLNLFNLK